MKAIKVGFFSSYIFTGQLIEKKCGFLYIVDDQNLSYLLWTCKENHLSDVYKIIKSYVTQFAGFSTVTSSLTTPRTHFKYI